MHSPSSNGFPHVLLVSSKMILSIALPLPALPFHGYKLPKALASLLWYERYICPEGIIVYLHSLRPC